MKRKFGVYRLVLAALMLALCMALPFLTGQIPQIGGMLLPMHLPVLLCGFLCGPWYGLFVGLVAPLLRFLLFGMPPIFPIGVAMSLEMAVYGLAAGLLYEALPKKALSIYISLLAAMAAGRLVWGAAQLLLLGIGGGAFTWTAFLSGAVLNAIPGIILQIVLIPLIVLALEKARLTPESKELV